MTHVAEAATHEQVAQFQGGQVILANRDSTMLYKGVLETITPSETWTQITMTITHFAQGTLDTRASAAWQEVATGNAPPANLSGPGVINSEGDLVFEVPTPRGSTAVISRP